MFTKKKENKLIIFRMYVLFIYFTSGEYHLAIYIHESD